MGVRETGGEMDLVARHGSVYVFVEVKTRKSTEHGEPWEAVNLAKQRRVVRTAVEYLTRRRLKNVPVQFDVVGITWPDDPSVQPTISHFPNAFVADARWLV
jgi:putative endonuclease